MKLFKDNQNNIFAYADDGSQDNLIGDKIAITQAEADAIIESRIDKVALCKSTAKALLAASDWSVLPDVQITNKAAFDNYRAILRGYVISPVTDPTWPVEPQPVWG